MQCLFHEADYPAAVVEGCVFGEEAVARGRDEGVAEVGEDIDAGGVWGCWCGGVVED